MMALSRVLESGVAPRSQDTPRTRLRPTSGSIRARSAASISQAESLSARTSRSTPARRMFAAEPEF